MKPETNPLERINAVFRREEPVDRVPIFELMINSKVIEAIVPGGTYDDLTSWDTED